MSSSAKTRTMSSVPYEPSSVGAQAEALGNMGDLSTHHDDNFDNKSALPPGTYIITNVGRKMRAALCSPDNPAGVVASLDGTNLMQEAGEEWIISHHGGDSMYRIQNKRYSTYAGSTYRPRPNCPVECSDEDFYRSYLWRIREQVDGEYMIENAPMNVCWYLADGELQSPVELARCSTHPSKRWNFERLDSEDLIPTTDASAVQQIGPVNENTDYPQNTGDISNTRLARPISNIHFSPVPNYSNTYSQPRSAPGRANYNVSSLYSPWSNGNPTYQPASSYPFDHHDPRYQQQTTDYHSSYSSQRMTQPIPSDPHNPRRLPPLLPLPPRLPPLFSPPSADRDERRQPTSYPLPSARIPVMNNDRSATASYPPEYGAYQANTYTYPTVLDPRSGHSLTSATHPSQEQLSSRNVRRAASPYSRSPPEASPQTHTPQSHSPQSYSSQSHSSQSRSASPIDGSMIKKKRKRADSHQLSVLNETYNRTAFPSTEERSALAKMLDMSARSVQIWFQSKRQSVRQASRQSSTSTAATSTHHHAFTQRSHDALSELSAAMDSGIHHDAPYTLMNHGGNSRSSIHHQSPPPLLPSTSSSHHRTRTKDKNNGPAAGIEHSASWPISHRHSGDGGGPL